MEDEFRDIAALAVTYAPATLKGLVENMRTGSASAKTKAAIALRARMAVVREILPLEAEAICGEVDAVLDGVAGSRER
jgi:hypothetical protein